MKTLKESLCACALVLCAWTAVPAHAQTNATLGNVDGVVGDGTGAVTLRGWACWVGYVIHPYSPQIKLYAGGEAGKGGVELGTYQVDQPSEQAVQDICKNQNPNNRFAIGISIAVRQQYGGQRLYIYAETLGAPTNSYTLLPGSGQYTVPVAPAVTDSVYYIHTDRLGSNVIMTDANANVVAETEYKAYGAAADSNQKSEAPGYTGQYEDPLTGLTYMQQRYYDADLGRFISVDPVAARSGDVFNFNRYAYAANSPLNFVDPTGMDWCQAQVNGVNAGIGYCGDSGAPTIYGSSGQGGGANGGPYGGGGGGGSIPTEKPVNVTANRPPDDLASLSPVYVTANLAPKSWYCTKGAAAVSGAVVGGGVGGALTAMVDLKGNPYGIAVGALAGGVASGSITAFNNQISPYIGGGAGGMLSNMLGSAITNRNSAAVAVSGIASYLGSVLGVQPNVTSQMISRSAPYMLVTTVATAPALGKGALVAGPMIGLASGIADYATEAGWNSYCGN